jgi:hypothetical protein
MPLKFADNTEDWTEAENALFHALDAVAKEQNVGVFEVIFALADIAMSITIANALVQQAASAQQITI